MNLKQRLIARVTKLASDYQDAEYQVPPGGCSYLSGNVLNAPGTGCIWGQAIAAELPECLPLLEEADSRDNGEMISDILQNIDAGFSVQFLEWADCVQLSQDRGVPWGEAVEDATNQVGLEEE